MAMQFDPIDACPSDPGKDVSAGIFAPGFGFDYPWGAKSTACNLTNINMQIQANVTTNVLNETNSTQSNTILITGKCVSDDCDDYQNQYNNCCVEMNVSNQEINENNVSSEKNVQLAYSSTQVQQQMLLQMLQQSTAVSKGLSLTPNTSNATNIMNAVMKMEVSVTTNISNICNTAQSNALVISSDGFNTFNVQEDILNQTNESTESCTQVAVTKSKVSQAMTAQLAQIATAESIGVSLFMLLLILVVMLLFCLVPIFAGVAFLFSIMGVIFVAVGLILVILAIVNKKKVANWCGFSPGIQASKCASKYQPKEERIHYPSGDKAQDYCFQKGYSAMDWVVDPSDSTQKSGFATFYTGGDYPKKPTGCDDITNCNYDRGNQLMSFQNCNYVNGSGPPNDKTTYGDVYLNYENGDLYFKIPPFKDSNDLKKGFGDGDPVWGKPSDINIGYNGRGGNLDNVFTNSTVNGGGRAFLWVPFGLNSITLPDPKTSSVLDPNNMQFGFVESPFPSFGTDKISNATDVIGYGQEADSYPVGKNAKVKIGDYFVVVYPYGWNARNGGSAGTDGDGLERYDYGQQYKLYKAVQLPVSKKWVPNISDATQEQLKLSGLVDTDKLAIQSGSDNSWTTPMNFIGGNFIIPVIVEQFDSTMFVYQVGNTSQIAVGSVLVFIGFFMIWYGWFTRDTKANEKQQAASNPPESQDINSLTSYLSSASTPE